MDVLNKTIKKLTAEEYQQLLEQVAGNRKGKPFILLETSRQRDVEDSEMMDILQVNPSAYYTLKSRLNSKIASVLSKKVSNPIQNLMDEVSKVPAHLFGNNRDFSKRALKELEKQLLQYDMNAELITLYKVLAQLSQYTDDEEYYRQKYDRHVAFSLAVSKAENLFFSFFVKMGHYQLSRSATHLHQLKSIKRELSNISELYDSHRLFVLYNIANIYYLCNVPAKRDGLKSRELEIESVLQQISGIFSRYPLDVFYLNMSGIIDMMYFEYYVRTGSYVRAEHYLQRIHEQLPEIVDKHALNCFVVHFLRSKIIKFMGDGQLDQLAYYTDQLEKQLDVSEGEVYHYISIRRFVAAVRYYQRDYQAAAKKINERRNELSFKHYVFTDIDLKMFQALQYCIMGQDTLCQQIIASLSRQVRERAPDAHTVMFFNKLLKTALKPSDYRKKVKKINDMWLEFEGLNKGDNPLLSYLRVDEAVIRKMTNPIKES